MKYLEIYDRYTKKIEREYIYGGNAVSFFYENPFGKKLSNIIALPFISTAYGYAQSHPMSANKVPGFIQKFNVDMNQYEKGSYKDRAIENSYKSFNEFFIRKFKKEQRDFKKGLSAFSEGRYLGFEENTNDINFPVKGKFLNASDLLKSKKWESTFSGGPIIISRLCPLDYHRYHYPDDCKTIDSYTIGGAFHSVNPLALKVRPSLFLENVRRVSILETKNFKKIAMIEVGATCVGKIVQTHDERKEAKKSDEKGYFLFGGSTVIVLGQKGAFQLAPDLVENSKQGKEVFIKLGDTLSTI